MTLIVGDDNRCRPRVVLSDAVPWPQPKSPTRLKGVISRVALHLVRISYKFFNALTHFDVNRHCKRSNDRSIFAKKVLKTSISKNAFVPQPFDHDQTSKEQ